jgi:ATP-dependent DNA ligase
MQLAKFKYFYPEKPRLIQLNQPLLQSLSNDPKYVAEKKYNGSRLELHHINNVFQFWNRHGQLLKYQPSPEIKEALQKFNLEGYWTFDGELRHNKTKGVRDKIILWDVFIAKGVMLIDKPYWYRHSLLAKILPIEGEPIGRPMQYKNNFVELFKEVISEEIEGLVIKGLSGKLQLGRTTANDSNWMFKVRKTTGRHKY